MLVKWVPLKMHFPRNYGVGSVLVSSCMSNTLRFSALASCLALSPASMRSSARDFLGLMYRMYFTRILQEQKPATRKSLFLKVPNRLLGSFLISGILFSPTVHAANKAPVTTPTSPQLEQRLVNIERLLQSNALLDMLQQIELLQKEISQLRGEIEVNNHVLNQMKKRQRDLYTDIDRRLQAVENPAEHSDTDLSGISTKSNPPLKTLGTTETVNPPASQAEAVALTLEQTEKQATNQQAGTETEGEATDETETVTTTSSEPDTRVEPDVVQIQAEYQHAFKLLKQSQYDQSIKAFAKFVEAHPDNQYSDNAQYWMAEALYVKRQYEDAIREYNNLVSNYPESQKVPHGLLKIGYSYQELGKTDEAKLWYTDVRQRFPGTTASRLADDRLKHINDS